MNYEKGEPSIFVQKRKVCDNSSVSSCYLPFYKCRRPDQRRRISRSPEHSKRYSMEDKDCASKRHGMKLQGSGPRFSESDLCLQEVHKRKRKDFFTTSMIDSNMQKPYCDYRFGKNEHGKLMGRSNRMEMPGSTLRTLGAKYQSMKENQAKISKLKPSELRSDIQNNRKPSKQSPNIIEADCEVLTNPQRFEPFLSERSGTGKLSGIKVRAPSRNVFSFGEFSTSALDIKGSNKGIQEQCILDKAGFGYRRSSMDNKTHFIERGQDSKNQSSLHGKYNGYSDQFFETSDDAMFWTTVPDTCHMYVDPRRKKRRIRNSSSKYDSELQDRLHSAQNVGFVYSRKQFTPDKTVARRYPNQESWAQSVASEYENRNAFGDIQCKDKNFSYSHNLPDTAGFVPSPASENKHLWEQTIIEESTISMDKSNEHSSYEGDEIQDDSSFEPSASPKKQHSWKRYEKSKGIPYSGLSNRVNECPVNDWTSKTKQRQCSSSKKDIWNDCAKQAKETSLPDPAHLNEENDIVLVPFWTCTRWMGEASTENTEEPIEAHWAYEVYSNTCQKSSVQQAISGVKYPTYIKPMKGDIANNKSLAKPLEKWKISGDGYVSPYLPNYTLLEHDRGNKDSQKYTKFTGKQLWKVSHQRDRSVDYSELRCSEDSVSGTYYDTQCTNSQEEECLVNTETTSEFPSDRDMKMHNFQEKGTSTHIAKAVQTSFITSELQCNPQSVGTCFQDTEEYKKLTDNHACTNLEYPEQCRCNDPPSRQTPCSVDEKLIRTVHSIKEDIESVLQMLTSLEVQEENIDDKACDSLKGNMLDNSVPSEKLDTLSNVSCATDFVKRAFEKLLSFKNTIVLESTEDDLTKNHSYEEYKKGKDDYIATAQNEVNSYDIETISYYKINQQNPYTTVPNENESSEEDQIAKHYADKSSKGRTRRKCCNSNSPISKSGNEMEMKNMKGQNNLHGVSIQNHVDIDNDLHKHTVARNVEITAPSDYRGKDKNKKQHKEKTTKKSLPVFSSNELNYGSKRSTAISAGESDSQPSTKQSRKNRNSSLSPNKETFVLAENVDYLNGTYPPPTFIGSKERIHRIKPHKRRRKSNMSAEKRMRHSDVMKNRSPRENSPEKRSIVGGESIHRGEGIDIQRPTEFFDYLTEAEHIKRNKKFSLLPDFENEITDSLDNITKVARSKDERKQMKKLSLGDKDDTTPEPKVIKKVSLNDAEQTDERTSPSPNSRRGKVVSAKIVITPTCTEKNLELSGAQIEKLPEHSNAVSKSSMKEITNRETNINKHVVVSNFTDTETQMFLSTDQGTKILTAAIPEVRVKILSPGRRSKKSSHKKRSSRNRTNKRRKNSFLIDKNTSDTSKLSSSDTNLVKDSLERKRSKAIKGKSYQATDISETTSEAPKASPTFISSDLQESPYVKAFRSNSEGKPHTNHTVSSVTGKSQENLSTNDNIDDFFESLKQSNEEIASAISEEKKEAKKNSLTTCEENLTLKTCIPPASIIIQENLYPKTYVPSSPIRIQGHQQSKSYYQSPSIQRHTQSKTFNLSPSVQTPRHPKNYNPSSSLITQENKLRRNSKQSADVSASELNISIKKLYEEINKLRLQLEASAEEIASRTLSAVDEQEHSYKYARSFQVYSSLNRKSPETPTILEIDTSNLFTGKQTNSSAQGDFGSTRHSFKDAVKEKQKNIKQDKTEEIKLLQKRELPVRTSMSEIDNDEDDSCQVSHDDGTSSEKTRKNCLNPQKKSVTKMPSLSNLEGVPKDCAVVKLNSTCNRHNQSSCACVTENTFSEKTGQEDAIYWPNDDAYVTAACDISDKSDTQADATEKFETANSGSDEFSSHSRTHEDSDHCDKSKQPVSTNSIDCDTKGKKMKQPDVKLVYTRESSPSKLLAGTKVSETSLVECGPSSDKRVQESTLSISQLKDNQLDEKKISPNTHESINNNMKTTDCDVWPAALDGRNQSIHNQAQSPVSYIAVRSVSPHPSSITVHDTKTGEFNNDINYQPKFYNKAECSVKTKAGTFLEMCSEIHPDANDAELDSKNNTNEPSDPWFGSPVYAVWNEVCAPAEQNTSQNKGSPKERLMPENTSFQIEPQILRSTEMTVNEKDSVSASSIPLFIKCVKDVLLGSTKLEAKELNIKRAKPHACPARNKPSPKKYVKTFRENTSKIEDAVEHVRQMDEVCIGDYIKARKRGRCHTIPEQIETILETAPKIDNYVSRRQRLPEEQTDCSSHKLSVDNEEKNFSVFDKQIVWKNHGLGEKQIVSRDIVVTCGLDRKHVSMTSQNSPLRIKAAHYSDSYSSSSRQDQEPDKVMSHYSDVINAKTRKCFIRPGFTRLNVSSVSKNHDSNTERSEAELSGSEKECSNFYDELTIKGRDKSSYSEKSELHENFDNARTYHRSDCLARNEAVMPLNRRPASDENSIIATFESLMQQKRPYYVEHCGKKKERIVIDQCVNNKVMQGGIKMEHGELNSTKPVLSMVTVANDNNSSTELKSVRMSTGGYRSECSDLRSDFYDMSNDGGSDLKVSDVNSESLVDIENYREDNQEDVAEDRNDRTYKVNGYDEKSQHNEETPEVDEDKTVFEEEGESCDHGESKENKIASKQSYLDTDELESWYKPTDEESPNCFNSEDNDQEEKYGHYYCNPSYLDIEQDESEENDYDD